MKKGFRVFIVELFFNRGVARKYAWWCYTFAIGLIENFYRFICKNVVDYWGMRFPNIFLKWEKKFPSTASSGFG